MLSKKQKKIALVSLIGLSISGTGLFFTVGGPYLDNMKANKIENRLASFVENDYINSVKESVKVKDVEDIQSSINKIKNTTKKKRLQLKAETLLEQAKLQNDLLDKLKDFQDKKSYKEIDLQSLTELTNQASGIHNNSVKQKVFKEANELLDKVNFANYVIEEANKITPDSPGQYYTVKSLSESVEFDDAKEVLELKLSRAKTDLEKNIHDKDVQKKENEQKKIEIAKQGEVYDFTKGTTTQKEVSEREYLAYDKLIKNPHLSGKKVVSISSGKISVLQLDLSNKKDPTVSEIITVDYERNRSGKDAIIFTSYSLDRTKISLDNFSIGMSNSDDVQVSEQSLNKLRSALR